MFESIDTRTAAQRLTDRLSRLGLAGEAPAFTAAEIAMIVSVFGGRDDALSQSIALKARDFQDKLAVQTLLAAPRSPAWYSALTEQRGIRTKLVANERARRRRRSADMHSNVSTGRHCRARCGYHA